jgi:peptide/nickel transport system substrate-binding protein
VNNPRTRPQAGWYSWLADYPAPSAFIPPLLTCGASANLAHFCDRALDADAQRAAQLQVSDPQRASARWARIDRRITDRAPVVPLLNSTQVDFLSARAGNYLYNPQWGILLDQLWVR